MLMEESLTTNVITHATTLHDSFVRNEVIWELKYSKCRLGWLLLICLIKE